MTEVTKGKALTLNLLRKTVVAKRVFAPPEERKVVDPDEDESVTGESTSVSTHLK